MAQDEDTPLSPEPPVARARPPAEDDLQGVALAASVAPKVVMDAALALGLLDEIKRLRAIVDAVPPPARVVKVGFDVGGVLSKYPHLLRPIWNAFIRHPEIEVHVLSDMSREKLVRMLTMNNFFLPPERIHTCDYAAHGGECKSLKAKEIGLDVLWDDMMDYVSTVGEPELRLLVMADPTTDYCHPDWKTDESDAHFGRRTQPSLRKTRGNRKTED